MTLKGLKVLSSICEVFGSEFIESVVSATDSNIHNDYNEEIVRFCRTHKIRYFDHLELIPGHVDFIIAISWKWMLTPHPDTQLIVFHDSILPKYRGFNPLVSCLINAEAQIGATAIFGSNNYDEGDIIAQQSSQITYPIKIQKAIEIMSDLYVKMAIEICSKVKNDEKLKSYPQDHDLASYCLWRDDHDYHINWNQSSDAIARFIDSVGFPYLGAHTFYKEKKIRVIESRVHQDVAIANRTPGKVIFVKDNSPVIVCKKGLLQLLEMQDESGIHFKLDKFRTRFT